MTHTQIWFKRYDRRDGGSICSSVDGTESESMICVDSVTHVLCTSIDEDNPCASNADRWNFSGCDENFGHPYSMTGGGQ